MLLQCQCFKTDNKRVNDSNEKRFVYKTEEKNEKYSRDFELLDGIKSIKTTKTVAQRKYEKIQLY